MRTVTHIVRYVFLAIWLALILGGIASYIISPSSFTAENIALFLVEFQGPIWLLYILFSAVRGFTLLPSTPLVIAGTMLFPQQPWLVFAVSLFGIVVSSTMIYWLSDALGIAEYFETRKPQHVSKIRQRLEHPTGILFVLLWAFFPLVPTDAVCYVAGSMRMHFPKFIAAVLAGELILCSIYIFGGSQLLSLF